MTTAMTVIIYITFGLIGMVSGILRLKYKYHYKVDLMIILLFLIIVSAGYFSAAVGFLIGVIVMFL